MASQTSWVGNVNGGCSRGLDGWSGGSGAFRVEVQVEVSALVAALGGWGASLAVWGVGGGCRWRACGDWRERGVVLGSGLFLAVLLNLGKEVVEVVIEGGKRWVVVYARKSTSRGGRCKESMS